MSATSSSTRIRVTLIGAFCVGVLYLLSQVKPAEPGAGTRGATDSAGPAGSSSAGQTQQSPEPGALMSETEFKRIMLEHWFPTENRNPPPADVQALIGLKGGEQLTPEWRVRGIRVLDNGIRVELYNGLALLVAFVMPVENFTLPPVKTQRYALTAVGLRPGPQYFADLDVNIPLEAVAKRIRETETSVPMPKGLKIGEAQAPPGMPGHMLPADGSAAPPEPTVKPRVLPAAPVPPAAPVLPAPAAS